MNIKIFFVSLFSIFCKCNAMYAEPNYHSSFNEENNIIHSVDRIDSMSSSFYTNSNHKKPSAAPFVGSSESSSDSSSESSIEENSTYLSPSAVPYSDENNISDENNFSIQKNESVNNQEDTMLVYKVLKTENIRAVIYGDQNDENKDSNEESSYSIEIIYGDQNDENKDLNEESPNLKAVQMPIINICQVKSDVFKNYIKSTNIQSMDCIESISNKVKEFLLQFNNHYKEDEKVMNQVKEIEQEAYKALKTFYYIKLNDCIFLEKTSELENEYKLLEFKNHFISKLDKLYPLLKTEHEKNVLADFQVKFHNELNESFSYALKANYYNESYVFLFSVVVFFSLGLIVGIVCAAIYS